MKRLAGVFLIRALRHRNYRLFFFGQSISLIGSWMTRIATSWLVYRLTGSALLLGLSGFAGQIPMFILAPFTGVLVDRWDRHHILVVTQILAMIQSLALAALTFGHVIAIHHIIVLAVIQGLINTLDMPARQAFVVQMVDDRADLANAIALNSSMVNGARLLGPSIAGIIIAAVGEAPCFLIDGISYIAVVAALLAMKLKPAPPRKATGSAMRELRDGIGYCMGFAPIRAILLLLGAISPHGSFLHRAHAGIRHDGPGRDRPNAGLPDGPRQASAHWPARFTWRRGAASLAWVGSWPGRESSSACRWSSSRSRARCGCHFWPCWSLDLP